MNKKGKHKKGKVPNPSPSQDEKELPSGDKIEELVIGDKKEDVPPVSDNVQISEEKVESVPEKRVPEIVSENIKPAIETKDEDSPKKPKRNRGKKKKGKDDDFDDFEEIPKEAVKEQPSEEPKVDVPEGDKPEDLPPITPTTRKKKNKKKNADQTSDEPISSEQEVKAIPTEIKQEEKQEHIKQEFIKTESVEPEIKPAKKKKNKKKRNDSERSDKEEISCTSAFQKILDDKEEETKIEEQTQDNVIPLETTKAEDVKSEIKCEPSKESIPIEPVLERAPTPVKLEEQNKETPAVDGKGKKKNKKDKKHMPKPEESPKIEEPIVEQTLPSVDVGKAQQDIIPPPIQEVPIATQEELPKEIDTPKPLDKESPKPKAKIAKPVEKKRKGKQEVPESVMTETGVPEPISESLKVEETSTLVPIVEPPEQKIPEQVKVAEVEPKMPLPDISDIPLLPPDEDETLIAQEFELLAEKAMGKKRKKASKMPKSLEIQEQKSFDDKQTDIKEDALKEPLPVISEILTPQAEKPGFNIVTEKCEVPIVPIPEAEAKEIIKPPEQPEFQGKVLLTPENVPAEKEFTKEETTTQKTDDKQKTDKGKKRKKSPKPPKRTDVQVEETSASPRPEEAPKTSHSEETTQQSLSEKIDASNITRMYDIEISSIKPGEPEFTPSDVVPDITYPRATSQQLTDPNNNTVIREIFPLQPVTLGSILTPDIKTPTVIDSSIKTPEAIKPTEASPPREEKTDIKSKMMEVNQDMEELRLSIERSLAELTSIEKSEDTLEKQFEATKQQSERISNILFETSSVSSECKDVDKKVATKDPIVPLEEAKVEPAPTPATDDISKPAMATLQQIMAEEKKATAEQSKKASKKQKKHEVKVDKKPDNMFIPFIDEQPIETPTAIKEKSVEPQPVDTTLTAKKPLTEEQKVIERPKSPIPLPAPEIAPPAVAIPEKAKEEEKPTEQIPESTTEGAPVCPARKDQKGKNKKKKGKQDTQTTPQTATPQSTSTSTASSTTQSQTTQEPKKEEKTESKSENKSDNQNKGDTKQKGKQQSDGIDSTGQEDIHSDYEPIENFEDALTSSVDDVNKTFEIIVKESQEQNNPKINIIAPDEEKTTVSPPKNLLSQHDIPVPSNRRDYKKEKDKIPNEITAKVKIKDSVEIERKQSKNTQTNNNMKDFSKDYKINDNDDFVYKYSFRKVFLQSACHVCKKALSGCRVPCSYCNLLFYCSNKHKDEDWPQHQALCFAVSTIVHLKDQKHIYADAKNLTGHDYRLIRMQMIVSCEKVLKRRLVPWEQEALLYPRVCAHVPCREWRQGKLRDCQECGQISYCSDTPDHFPSTHARWCKSYSLYEKLVSYQQTKGRLEPKLPTRVLKEPQQIPEKINEVLASMYEEKIDMNDIQYAALTQLATAPLTAAYCHQLCKNKLGSQAGVFKSNSFTIHVVGAELQFEADALNKWEVFFLHLRPDLQEVRVVLINYNLNPSNLPLELLGKIKLCENCRQNKRRVVFSFQDKRTYAEYKASEEFSHPDIVCAFNPSIQRSSVYNGKDPWPSTINVVLKLKVPFIITGYTITELHKDCIRIKECSESGYNFIAEPKYNNFASVRPDRNFISDDEMPLLFKNYCFAVISG
ncbi:unnamed protein product [Chrysodeixis includens]|uniref:MYND-type domain-containing protein n=1 Tax=Chrysodeixis includens TaxID=689277 RepID=A0A9P0BWP4_CHRIL|nr:unnamed protein product [Chrysodeixis includens]